MNRDELSALALLESNLGWKMVCAEFFERRKQAAALVMNPDTPLEEVERQRLIYRGVNEVLTWPTRMLAVQQPVEQMPRAGIMQGPPEEE